MKVLLDTHAFIWWDSEPNKLSEQTLELLFQPKTIRFVSVVSLWEIQIKHQLGKLALNQPLEEIYQSQGQNGITFLTMSPAHIFNLSALPQHHKDPFDRMLISQAMCDELTVISKDSKFQLYDVSLISA